MRNAKLNEAALPLEEERERQWLDNIKITYNALVDEYGEAYCLEQIELAKQRVLAGMSAREWKEGAGALEAAALAAQAMLKANSKAAASDSAISFVLLAGVDIAVPGYFSHATDENDRGLLN
jgi:hypothetical protein